MINKKLFNKVRGLLIDIDGTLYFKGVTIRGAIETVSKLRKTGIRFLFLTNTDSKSPKTILKILQNFGFTVSMEEIFTPIIALKEFLSKNPEKILYLITTEEVAKEFHEFPQVKGSEIPDYVIIGDFHDNWDFNRVNIAFQYVLKGAKLLGTQGNIYYLDRNGEPVIDTGSFVQMVANAANVTPKIFGKPSKEYFLQALKILDLSSDEVMVIGDDIDSDIQGAINAGIKGILVKTGKAENYDPSKTKIIPYSVLNSFSEIKELI